MTLDLRIMHHYAGFALDINTRFQPGITALFGPSGAGKSTLLHCIAGLIRPESGQITLQEETLLDTKREIDVPAYRRKIGLVFQDGLLFPHLTIRANLQYGQKGSKSNRREEFNKIVDLMDIEPLLDRRTDSLSGGEKKRAALARAILAKPQWLLLDEPFSGLDQFLKDQVTRYLRRLHQAVSVPMILVSHCQEEIADLADEVIFIENGQLTGRGRLEATVSGSKCFCHNSGFKDLQNVKNWLIKNHSLQFKTYRCSEPCR